MEEVIKFLRTRDDIPIRGIEKSLGLPNATINVKRGYVTPKHFEAVRDYLIDHYGYVSDEADVSMNEDNRNGGSQIVKLYNVRGIPGFADDVHRYKDVHGLWRRLDSYMVIDKTMGVSVLKNDWRPKDGEVMNDHIGGYYIANNGNMVYISYNKKKK